MDSNKINMNGLDIVFIILLIWGGYHGLKKGFITELMATALVIFGCIKGITLFYTLLPIIADKLPTCATCIPMGLAILMLFIGGLVIYWLTILIKKIVAISLLGMFDHLLGGVLGVCKVAFFISLLIYFWGCLGLTTLTSMYTDHSFLFPLLESIVPKILKLYISIDHICSFKSWRLPKVVSCLV